MANSYFQFKQFRVEQAHCAMKVCTDACIQGAYTTAEEAVKILDIGCGTGLLSLMIAQRHPKAHIDAIEIDRSAFEQALENVRISPWAARINVEHLPIQSFFSAKPYDLIIANPPFYPQHLRSPNQQRNQAQHQDSLSFFDLAKACKRLLAPYGFCSILLPPRQAAEFTLIAEGEGLFPGHELEISESEKHKPQRSIRFFYHKPQEKPSFRQLNIKDIQQDYSPAFRQLLKTYYSIF